MRATSPSPHVILDVTDVTPEWLTRALRDSRMLSSGEVQHVQAEANSAFNSVAAHLRLTYSSDAPADAPRRLFLKLKTGEGGAHEAAFYRLAEEIGPARLPMLPRVHLAAFDPGREAMTILLDDLSDTHGPPVERADVLALNGLPSQTHLDQIIDVLAAFHAAFWEDPRLGEDAATGDDGWPGPLALSGNFTSRKAFLGQAGRMAGWWRDLRERDDAPPSEVVSLYDRAAAGLPSLWERYFAPRFASKENLTLIHGDCYFSQFVCPSDPQVDRTHLIDFETVSTSLGADDLVFLMATFWTPEQRAKDDREMRCLQRYHAGLGAGGVDIRRYPFEQLLEDYRLMLIWRIFHPVWDTSYGCGKGYWWPKMQCLTGAYRDLRCADLLGS
jgi:hypothetical protein